MRFYNSLNCGFVAKPYTFRMSDLQGRLPPLGTLVHFESAYRHRNFTHAAAELHFSQATVSRRISELERFLGVMLFHRGRHDVRPTTEADVLATAVRLTLTDLAATTDRVRRRPSTADSLVIYSDLSLSSVVITPILGIFQRRNPEVEIRVLSSFEPIGTTQHEFDVGLQYGPNDADWLVAEPVADDVVFPVSSPDFAAALPSKPSAADLSTLPLLHADYADRPTWTDWQQFLERFDVQAPSRGDGLSFDSYLICLDVAERGEGVALGWGCTVQPRLDSGRLVRLNGLAVPRPGAIEVYRPREVAVNPIADEFVTLLRNSLSGSANSADI